MEETKDTASTAEWGLNSCYHLILNTINDESTVDILIHKLNECLATTVDREEFFDILADVLVQCDIETSVADHDKRQNFINITKSIIRSDVLPLHVALERFDFETSAEIGIVSDKRQFGTSYNRLRTRLYFKQKKFNLLREENEGFAKILTEISQLSRNNLQSVLASVTEIIGKYRVDPNRVLDLILETFEYNSKTEQDLYIEFLNAFYTDIGRISQLIILKLNFYINNKIDLAVNPQPVPQSFYRVVALLIHKEIIDLDDIYPFLLPPDTKILEYHKRLVDEARIISRKYATAVVGEEKPTRSVFDSLSDEEQFMLETDNHKLNLCAHLIDIGNWDQALAIARKLPEFYCFSYRRVASLACSLISYFVDPIYRECALPKPLNSRIRPIPETPSMRQLKTIQDLQDALFPMLSALGPFLSADHLVLTKVIRLLKHLLTQKVEPVLPDSPLYYRIVDVINDSILPSLSLTGSNCCLARELWQLMKLFSFHTRYKFYYNWRDEGSNPYVLRARGQILLKAKHHMKRLSKETLRLTGRHLGKLCYSNPVITLNYILVQIQSYDNLITLVVDALRFLPPVAHDVLIYCIIEALSDSNKNKKSFDGMALAPWLTSLSAFSAQVILRNKVDIVGFLEYIANQLKAGNSLDLVLLADLIQKMTGIETIQAITDDKIEALTGGDVLRTEGAYFNQVKNTRKPSARLRDALVESRLAMPMCIMIAQLRDSLFYNQQDGTPLKLVGKLYDQCQETLVQYGVFLSMNLNIDNYSNFLPPLDHLLTDYKLDPDSAFFLARPMILHKIKSKFHDLKLDALQSIQIEEGETPELSCQAKNIKFVEAARSVIEPIAAAIEPSLTEKYGTSNLNAKLFVIFWTLSMSDIEVPVKCYERKISCLKQSVTELEKSPQEDPKRRKEKERCNNLIQKLKQELAEQQEHAAFIKMYLESEKNNLFCERSGYDQVYLESRQFVQYCPYARSILTAYDAIYSARFLLFLHELRVENYPTIVCLDRLLCDVTYMMGACTENEANHYGRFLCNILKTTAYWHSDEEYYREKCENFPGSIINISNSQHITYEKYRDICFKWHYRLTKAFTVALESNNYVQIRNALIVMISIIEQYPVIKNFAKGIGMKIEDVRNNEKENRQDLYALATAYAGKLDERKSSLIPESNFHIVDDLNRSHARSSSSSSSSNKKRRKVD